MNTKALLCLVLIVGLAVTGAGCTETQKGAGVGALAGGAGGALIGSFFGVPGMGAAIGAGGGALGGALIGDQMEKKDRDKEKQELEQQLQEKDQQVQAAEMNRSNEGKTFIQGHYEYINKKQWVDTTTTERVWVPETVEGDRTIEGHYEEKPIPSGHWEEYTEKVWVPDHYE